tara:strand:- start:546 stop:752 length:207 start_codon:yes stop_codon:yes gene_type:complete
MPSFGVCASQRGRGCGLLSKELDGLFYVLDLTVYIGQTVIGVFLVLDDPSYDLACFLLRLHGLLLGCG